MDDPALMSPYFDKDFILYTFSIDFSYAVVLTQKKAKDTKISISFMRLTLKGNEVNYTHIDIQVYTVKHFRPYTLKSKTKVVVPYATIRNVLIQKDLREKRSHWMTELQEYDLGIKPANIVKFQGLFLLAA